MRTFYVGAVVALSVGFINLFGSRAIEVPTTCDGAIEVVETAARARGLLDGERPDGPLTLCKNPDLISIDSVVLACEIVAHGTACLE